MKSNFKKELIEHLTCVLESLIPHYKNIGIFGDVESSHGASISWFEMFARSVYGIIPYTKEYGNNKYVEIFNETIFTIIEDPRYKKFSDYDQKAVELIPIASMLFIHRKYTWDIYTEEQRNKITKYLENINKITLVQNNWQFFRIVVSEILQVLSLNDYSKDIKSAWEQVELCYQGNGWYRDGTYGPKDYYIAFGYHFYSLWLLYLFPNYSKKDKILDRAKKFAREYIYFFDSNGIMVPYGRSLIYRFATLSFWSVYLLVVDDDICYRNQIIVKIKHNFFWWKSQPIRNEEGIYNLGYAYRNEFICEDYNSSGSVYWILKFFLVLLLESESDLWDIQTGKEEEYLIRPIANGDIYISKNEHSTSLFPNSFNGSPNSQNTAKYMRFAYNSMAGFNLNKDSTNFVNLSDDSSLVFKIGGIKHQREQNLNYRTYNGVQEFLWKCGDFIKIKTYVIPGLYSYVRVHIIDSNIECTCYETGFALENKGISNSDSKCAIIKDNNTCSYIRLLLGVGYPLCITNQPNCNLYHKQTKMPSLKYFISKGINIISDITAINNLENSESKDNNTRISVKGDKIELYFNNNEFILNSDVRCGFHIMKIRKFIKLFKAFFYSRKFINRIIGLLK